MALSTGDGFHISFWIKTGLTGSLLLWECAIPLLITKMKQQGVRTRPWFVRTQLDLYCTTGKGFHVLKVYYKGFMSDGKAQ